MAKTESTAVNELIELMQSGNGKPAQPEPIEDLFTAPPKQTRMTSTVPPIQVAGDVAPLPRTRAPQGTQRLQVAPPPMPVRVSTAPPSRVATIPPIPQPPAITQSGLADMLEPEDSMVATTPNLGNALKTAGVNPKATLLGSGAIDHPRGSRDLGPTQHQPASASIASPLDRSALPPIPPPQNPKATLLGSGALDRNALPPIPPARTSGLPLPNRTSRPSGQMPTRPSAAHGTPAPELIQPATVQPPPPMALSPAKLEPIAPLSYPSATPYVAHLAPDMTSNQAWFDEAAVDAIEPIEHDIGTARVAKQHPWKMVLPRLIMPMIILVITGIFVGGYFAFDGDGGQEAKSAKVTAPKAAPTTETKAEPAAEPTADVAKAEPAAEPAAVKADEPAAEPAKTEPVAEPAKTEPVAKAEVKPEVKQDVKPEVKPEVKADKPVTPPNLVGTASEPTKPAVARPTLVDVRIESSPKGATVMIVDRGKTSFLGSTPIVASLDPSREYDIVFTYPNKPTQLEHIVPSKQNKLSVTLGKAGNQAKPELKAEKPRTEVKIEKPAKVEKPVVVKAEPKPEKIEKTEQPAVEAAPKLGEGVLMISSKPPCEIFIDGAPTGLTTPQRAIKLAAGKHKITLVNTAEKIKKTIAVEIQPDQPTKVIQDLMK